MNINKLSLRIACSTLALTCAAVAAPSWGQAKPTEPAAGGQAAPTDTQDDKAAEDIIVTGTNISGVKPVGNTAIVLTRDDAIKSGYSTPAELLRSVPQARSAEYEHDGGPGTVSLQNSGGSNSVSLRGLAGTLTLIDGRRSVSAGTNTSVTEANQIPLAAIDRIEIVADGASAVYGSDAVAGVINYVLRKDYSGVEMSLRGNNNAGGAEYGADVTAGAKWGDLGGLGRGNILVAYGYTHRDPYIEGKNPFLRYNGTPVGGIDRRYGGAATMTGYVPNIIVAGNTLNPTLPLAGANTYYGLPAGANVGLTAGSLRLNDPNLTDFSDYTDYVGRMERHQVAVYANQELGNSLELFLQANYFNRETLTHSNDGSFGSFSVQLRQFLRDSAGGVTATPNPYYISGIPGVAPGADLTVAYPALKDSGPKTYKGSDETYNITAGLRAKLPGGWKAEAFYTYGRNQGCGYCVIKGYVNLPALQYQIDTGAINPLSSIPLSAAQTASFTGSQTQIGHNGLDDAVIKFNGPLFALPGGTVRAAFGGERLKLFNYNENTSIAGTNNAVTILTNRANSYYHRTVRSVFGELYVPLIGEDMNVPLIKSLTASAAVRYDDYSDVSKTTNPKFGLTWDVADFLSFSGSWGTSYVAPSMTDKNPSAYVSGVYYPLLPVSPVNPDARFAPFCFPGVGCFAQGVGILFGSNPGLQPQTSTNWTLGAEFKPGGGFRAKVNYYNIDYRNKIVFPQTIAEFLQGPVAGSNPPAYRGYDSLIIPINNPATCVNTNLATADPVLQALLSHPIYGASTGVGSLGGFPNFCSIRGILDSRFTNLARTKTDGLDIDLSWTGNLGEVMLNANVAANVILRNNEIVIAGAAPVSRLNNLGDPPNPLKWRGRASIGAAYRGFTGTLFGNYSGPFINDRNVNTVTGALAAPVRIPAYTTFDLNLGYSTAFTGRTTGLLKGLRGSITILNLFDRDPQTVINKNGVFLEGRGSPFGRTVSFQLTGSF